MPKPHPLDIFWIRDSGWCSRLHNTPTHGLSEGQLAIDTWNAAIKAAASCVEDDSDPGVARRRIECLEYEA